MEHINSVRAHLSPKRMFLLQWRALLVAVAVLVLTGILALRRTQLERPDLSWWVLAIVVAALCVAIALHARYLLQARAAHMASEQRFRQMASNIQEIFWMIDAESKKVLYVNEAYETITGYSCPSGLEKAGSYEDLLHPEDRGRLIGELEEATRTGRFNGRFRIVCAGGEVRWVWVHGFPVRDGAGKICRLVGTAQEITSQVEAEQQVARNLELAQSAWAEAEALRKATMALTQDLRMDYVLDTLLQSLAEIIPCECAGVLLLEADTRLFLARERICPEAAGAVAKHPLTLDASQYPILERVRANRDSVLLMDTRTEDQWRAFTTHHDFRSWLCVPLISSPGIVGLLSVGHSRPHGFTQEHLRRAQLLAIPAAAAIENARLYERTEIYGAELERRIADLHQAQSALAQVEGNRRASEDKFQKVFRSSPIAFSITTFNEGRFLDVNAAFEARYGYSRLEVLGRTMYELRIWEDPSDRARMIAQLHQGGPIRNVITRFRTKSGEIKLTAYSADRIQFDGQACILAVSQDVPQFQSRQSN